MKSLARTSIAVFAFLLVQFSSSVKANPNPEDVVYDDLMRLVEPALLLVDQCKERFVQEAREMGRGEPSDREPFAAYLKSEVKSIGKEIESRAVEERACITSIDEIRDIHHPYVRLAALASLVRDVAIDDEELLSCFFPYLDVQLRAGFRVLASLRILSISLHHPDFVRDWQAEQSFNIRNYPVAELVLTLGADSIEPLLSFVESEAKSSLEPLTLRFSRFLMGIALLNELKAQGLIADQHRDRIDSAINNLHGDNDIGLFARLVWDYDVVFGMEGSVMGVHRRDPMKMMILLEDGFFRRFSF